MLLFDDDDDDNVRRGGICLNRTVSAVASGLSLLSGLKNGLLQPLKFFGGGIIKSNDELRAVISSAESQHRSMKSTTCSAGDAVPSVFSSVLVSTANNLTAVFAPSVGVFSQPTFVSVTLQGDGIANAGDSSNGKSTAAAMLVEQPPISLFTMTLSLWPSEPSVNGTDDDGIRRGRPRFRRGGDIGDSSSTILNSYTSLC